MSIPAPHSMVRMNRKGSLYVVRPLSSYVFHTSPRQLKVFLDRVWYGTDIEMSLRPFVSLRPSVVWIVKRRRTNVLIFNFRRPVPDRISSRGTFRLIFVLVKTNVILDVLEKKNVAYARTCTLQVTIQNKRVTWLCIL